MQSALSVLLIFIGYMVGAVPVGLVVVRLRTGVDVRTVGSGRSGATNVIRAAGFWPGFATGWLDVLKAALPVWLAVWLQPEAYWVHTLCGAAAVLGHNYSIFLRETVTDPESGRVRLVLRGGAGGAATMGGAMGLWPYCVFIIFPMGALVYFGIGYASVATLSIGVMTTVILVWRAATVGMPWEYTLYGGLCLVMQVYALRPNLKRLMNGTERLVGWRAKRHSGTLTADPGAITKE